MRNIFKRKQWVLVFGFGLLVTAAASAQTIKIGVIAALTGGGAPWGLATAEAAKIRAAEINAEGGLVVAGQPYKVEVIAYDDKYMAADAVAAYNRLVNQDGIQYVIIMGSAATLALKQRVEEDRVLALTSSYSGKALDVNTQYMVRLFSITVNYLPPIMDWLVANRQARRVYVVNPNDETGWDQDQVSGKLFVEKGFQILGRDLYERTQKDFQPLFTKIIATNPEMIDLGSTPPATAGIMIRQARDLGYTGLFIKTGGAGPRDIVAAAGKQATEGMVSVLYADPNNPGYRRVADQYKRVYGQEPNEILISFYDATSILLKAIQAAGDVNDTAKVVAAFPTVLPTTSAQGGTITLGGKAFWGVDKQFVTPMYIAEIRDGEPVVVGQAQ